MILLILLFLLGVVIPLAGLYKIFEKAGYKGWEALVPVKNYLIWLKIINKPKWWIIFLVVPFIHLIALLLMRAELANIFGKKSFGHHLIAWLFPFIYLPYLGFSKELKITGYTDKDRAMRTAAREWADAIVFAVIAATIIRTFLIEAFTIPSSSMQGTLLNGDYLFVSKLSYGPRIPNTPLSIPFVHNSLFGMKSYIESVKLPYYRLPGFGKVQRNDVVVFNFPEGDTVAMTNTNASYYALVRQKAFLNHTDYAHGRELLWKESDIVYRPVDKEDNYIKRCVAVAGDTLQIVDRKLYINRKEAYLAPTAQFNYNIKSDIELNTNELQQEGFIHYEDQFPGPTRDSCVGNLPLTADNRDKLQKQPFIRGVFPEQYGSGEFGITDDVFPHSSKFKWNRDNYGPLVIPKKGMTVKLTVESLPLYERLIHVYENNDLQVKDGKIYINGKESDSYTFLQDYYWMMGDNRHNSLDSRYWGYVPDDHVVGKGVFIWMSLDPNPNVPGAKKFTWKRAFTFIHPDGLSRPYIVPFLVLLGILFGISYYRGKKQQKAVQTQFGKKKPEQRKR